MRRDANDLEWQACKKKVFELDDGRCCLCKCMTAKEALLFEKSLQGEINQTKIIDPAHYKSVSTNTDIMYDPNNVFCLCRTMHNRIDYMKDPYSGKPINLEEREAYWQRIINTRKAPKTAEIEDMFYEPL